MEHPVSITAAAAAGTPPIEAAVSRGLAPFGRLCLWAAWGWMIIAPRGDGPRAADVVHASVANSPQPPSRRVSQAGGIDRSRSDVRPCGHVHPVGGHRCNGQCQGGGCPANCPVRPGSFGFYGTQWRAWPTQGAAETTGLSDATPVSPPKSEVPKLSEESLRQSPTGAEEPARPAGDDAGAGGAAGDANVEERPRELVPPPADVRPEAARDEAGERPDAGGRRPDAVPPLEPPEEEAAPKPPNAKEPAVPAVPDAGDENRKKDDDNLFDEARRGLRRQEILAVLQRRAARPVQARFESPAASAEIGGVRLTSHPDTIVGRPAAEARESADAASPSLHGSEQGTVFPASNSLPRGLRGNVVNGIRNPLRGSP